MVNQTKKWEILNKEIPKNEDKIISLLLKNRGIKSPKDVKEFLSPLNPEKITLKGLGVKETQIKKSIERIKKAEKNNENVLIYGDYDADGITATAILWEALHAFGLDVLPHVPDRFEEGYGLNSQSIENLKLKIKNLKLIITVDNGIVAYKGIEKAKELGIDVIIIDHHSEGKKRNCAFSIIHSKLVCGSALAYLFTKELLTSIKYPVSSINQSLELAAIGTVADQMPLIGVNRSIVKYGLEKLSSTKRPGLRAIFDSSKIKNVGAYEINYIIAPRINAMGRLAQGIDSLRLLCTTRTEKAAELSKLLNNTNMQRQRIVDEVVIHAKRMVKNDNVIVLADESYHEGVIGLAAGKLVEEFYKPAIVFSVKGKTSKASARSISGFNIIEAIRSVNLHLEGGGHPMAAGFSMETEKIGEFTEKINAYAKRLLTNEVLERKLKIDCQIGFDQITGKLNEDLKKFEPTGLGNFTPTFESMGVEIVGLNLVGRESKHLKIKLKQNEHIFDAIFFGGGEIYSKLSVGSKVDVAFLIQENLWNGIRSIQLGVRDIHI